MELELYYAVCDRDEIAVKTLLTTHPNIDVNWTPSPEYHNDTMLHRAVMFNAHNVVNMLLKHPGINVNAMTTFTVIRSPFCIACAHGCVEVVKVLLKDPRLDVNMGYDTLNLENCVNPLRSAVVNNCLEVIEHWIVSDVALPINPDYDELIQDALELGNTVSYSNDYKDIAQLLLDYKSGAEAQQRIRRKLKLRFGLLDMLAADIYALTIFLCDGLLSPVVTSTVNLDKKQEKMMKFFNITSQLPMEVQMLICYLAADVMKHNITTIGSEAGFRRLTAKLED